MHTRPLSALLLATLLAACAATPAGVAEAPANIGRAKLAAVQYRESGAYMRDFAAVIGRARAHVEARAGAVSRPALVLDIDETSLSNWPQLAANDFGYIPDGPCASLPKGPCGSHAWEDSGQGEVLAPTLELFKASRERGVAVFFITGRGQARREGTERNLRSAGYEGWAGLVLRPDGPPLPAAQYKSAERARIAAGGYTIIANVGDQQSDLDGGHAERGFLLPNPFYYIP